MFCSERNKFLSLILLAGLALSGVSCQKDNIVTLPENAEPVDKPAEPVEEEKEEEEKPKGRIPQNIKGIPRVYIDTPDKGGQASISKEEWKKYCNIRMQATLADGRDTIFYDEDSLKIKGRGNSTWSYYTFKRPYNLKLDHKADFLGTGKTKRWVLLANWMDKTLLRNDVAFEAARRTTLEWTPSGTFVDLYIDGEYRGNYWLGEKINVEGSNFLADYLYCYDTSVKENARGVEFLYTAYGIWNKGKKNGQIPAELKYPDLDDFPGQEAAKVKEASDALHAKEKILYQGNWSTVIDVNEFCDWFLVHELCTNYEPLHPKSCYFYIRDGLLHIGPAWDFDWGTFIKEVDGIKLNSTIYYPRLFEDQAFRNRLKQRWESLKPTFETLPAYIDQRAALIRESAEKNFAVQEFDPGYGYHGYGNPLSEDGSGMVNHDEQMTFQEAVETMKAALVARIETLDKAIDSL